MLDSFKSYLVKKVDQYWLFLLVIGFLSLAIGMSALVYGKIHNPFEHAVTDIIKNKIGVDVDAILPADISN